MRIRLPQNQTRQVTWSFPHTLNEKFGWAFLWTKILGPTISFPFGISYWRANSYRQFDLYVRVWWTRNIEISVWFDSFLKDN
jgi:hypothetical protein